ncbi:SPOR domain-containing protein [Micrococcus sp.]|uniref:SPOR domain-containing protein n=1 Tax=Micrococcus sp. TaxID=1271 RepID=UPI002A91C0D5|nr:SPOR domain-containing protein [Micrococcus sp.]MDY6055546.1 SPOR domain-containing protein [Micrococcus sp.]
MSDTTEYWFNVRTHEVEVGAQSDWKELLGPYATRQEAQAALERVRANNEAADAQDEEDDDWGARP